MAGGPRRADHRDAMMGEEAAVGAAVSAAADLAANSGPVALALAVGAVPLLVLLWWQFGRKPRVEPPEPFPDDGVFTLEVLKRFDGTRNPICLGVCGKVVDVSPSENIKHGEGYGKLWAGRDATYSLATLSLKPEDANILNYKVSDFTPEQHKALAGWYKHFTTKYTVVGRLQEYEGWDFSSVEEEAKSQTPFGAARTDGEAGAATAGAPEAAKEKAAEAAAAPAAKANGAEAKEQPVGVVFAKGDKVVLQNMEHLGGAEGVLQGYNPKEDGFEVRTMQFHTEVAQKQRVLLDATGELVVAKPAQLAKPAKAR